MNWANASRRGGATILLGAFIALLADTLGAAAQGRLTARYSIIMTGVTIGHVDWTVDVGDATYISTASGKASGMLALLINGQGTVSTVGKVANWHLIPVEFRSNIKDDDGITDLRIRFADGVAHVNSTPPLKPTPDRLAVTAAERRGVADPLSAVLIAAKPGESFFSADNCDHLLALFDGRRRYDLALSFVGVDKISLAHSYSGPVLVCRLVLRPIAGYRPDSLLIKYVAGRRDMELWLAPIAGTAIMAPIRLAMPTVIGTLKIQADRFDTVAKPSPVQTLPSPAQRPAAQVERPSSADH